MKGGALARQWITALAREVETRSSSRRVTGYGLNLTLPKVALPEVSLRWDVPDRLNAAERLRAKSYGLVYAGIVCCVGLVEALGTLKSGTAAVHIPFKVPTEGTHRGVGFWESSRSAVTHHIVVKGGTLDAYQILTAHVAGAGCVRSQPSSRLRRIGRGCGVPERR